MTGDRDLRADLRAWLEDVPATLPDRDAALRQALARVDLTPQRGRWPGAGHRSARPSATGRDTRRFHMLSIPAVIGFTMIAIGAAIGGGALLSSAPEGSPRVIVVDQNGPGDSVTIGEAVASARAGDTILVRPGTYRESVHVTQAITLRGDGDPGSVVIEAPLDGAELPGAEGTDITATYGLFVEGADARIENLHVLGLEYGVALVLRGGSPSVQDVTVELQGGFTGSPTRPHQGMLIDGDSTATLTRVSVVGWMDLAGSPTITDSTFPGTCIYVTGPGSAPLITDSTIVGCPYGFAIGVGSGMSIPVIEDADGPGGPTLTIRSSDIGHATTVIEVHHGASATMTGNTIHNGTTLVQLGLGASGLVEDNDILDGDTGVRVLSADAAVVVRGNRITGTDAGLVLTRGVAPTIESNDVRGNEVGLFVMGQASPVLSGNTICDNDVNVQLGTGASAPDLTGNEVCPDPSPAP